MKLGNKLDEKLMSSHYDPLYNFLMYNGISYFNVDAIIRKRINFSAIFISIYYRIYQGLDSLNRCQGKVIKFIVNK